MKIISKFFGREGGVSSAPYYSLNCGLGSGDITENVKQNRAIVAKKIGVSSENLLTLNQIHSCNVIQVKEPWQNDWPKADAMVTNISGLGLGVLTADCAPVLFSDNQNGVIGAAHAGWRGAIGGILENTIAVMEQLGAKRENISFQIGPCIAQKSYEVSDEFHQTFLDKNKSWERFFKNGARANHYQFDLPSFVATRLTDAGVKNADGARPDNFDTCSNEKAYFSYRRMTLRGELDYGRQISVIALK